MHIDSASGRNRTTDEVLRKILAENGVRRPDLRQNTNGETNTNPNFSCCVPKCDTCTRKCGDCNSENGLHDRSLASVYSPIQHWCKIYDNDVGLSKGTIFAELDLPFTGKSWGDKNGGGCRG